MGLAEARRGAGVGRALALVGLGAAAATAIWAARRAPARGEPHRVELSAVDRGTAQGVAAQLALRGIDVQVERTIDLTVEPAVERLVLVYPQRDDRRARRLLAQLLPGATGPSGRTGAGPSIDASA
jgi:hypothetical protein